MQQKVFGTCTITKQTSGEIPLVCYNEIKNAILGKKYELSIVFANTKTSQELNETYKHHTGPANILSFPYSTDSGEIIISLQQVRKHAKSFDHSYTQHLIFLLIHGMLHLLGHTHGHEMEKLEKKYFQKFL